jgi:hypothetical protein
LLKNESCHNCVLTIPLCRGGRDEATGKNHVEIGRKKRPYASSRVGGVAGHAHRRAPRVKRHTRLLHPDGLTRPEYQLTRPTCQTRIRMMSSWRQHAQLACHCSVQSADMSAQWDPPRHVTRREPSHEPRDRIQCSGSYVQPDLRLNLGRSSGQNCFDQVLAV